MASNKERFEEMEIWKARASLTAIIFDEKSIQQVEAIRLVVVEIIRQLHTWPVFVCLLICLVFVCTAKKPGSDAITPLLMDPGPSSRKKPCLYFVSCKWFSIPSETASCEKWQLLLSVAAPRNEMVEIRWRNGVYFVLWTVTQAVGNTGVLWRLTIAILTWVNIDIS